MGLFDRFFGNRPLDAAAHGLYTAIVGQARRPDFYLRLGVPDTTEGRFDMIVLHAVLVLRRLKRDGETAEELSQALFDLMFADMDRNLREMGVGDLAVGKRVKKMAEDFYGRLKAYEAGLEPESGEALEEALRRNLYAGMPPGDDQVSEIAAYTRRTADDLDATESESLMAGELNFGGDPR